MIAIYISANQFKVNDDLTAEFKPGRRIKADCVEDGYKYSTVVSGSYSNPYTTVTIAESELTSNLFDVLYGIINIGAEGSFPEHTHDSTEGQGGTIDFTDLTNNDIDFLCLTDTPATYSGVEGKYLQTTASGIEFVDAPTSSGDGGQGIDGQDGTDNNPVGSVIWYTAATPPPSYLICDGSAVSRTTYSELYAVISTTYGVGNGSTTFNLPDLRSEFIRGAGLGRGLDGDHDVGTSQDGTDHPAFHFSDSNDNIYYSGTDYTLGSSVGAEDIIDGELMDFAARGGSAGVVAQATYKSRPSNVALLPCIKYRVSMEISIGTVAIGQQSIQVLYKDTDEVTINPGVVHIQSNTMDENYQVTEAFDKQLTGLSASTWYYIYVSPPTDGTTTISDSDIQYSVTPPGEDLAKNGLYHPTNTTWRCIFATYSDSNSDILKFYISNSRIVWDSSFADHTNNQTSDTWTAQILTTPLWNEGMVLIHIYATYDDASGSCLYRVNESEGEGSMILRIHTASTRSNVSTEIPYDSSGTIETKWSTDTTNFLAILNEGFKLPDKVYTGSTQIRPQNVYARGTQSIGIEYNDTSSFYVDPGTIHIKGATTEEYYTVNSQITATVSGLTVDTWYYIYVKPPTSGYEITASEIEYTTSAPTRDLTKLGRYHTSNTDWRCIGSIYAQATDTIKPFNIERGIFNWTQGHNTIYSTDVSGVIGDSDETVDTYAPVFCSSVMVTCRVTYAAATGWFRWKESVSAGYIDICRVAAAQTAQSAELRLPIDSNQQAVLRATNDVNVWVYNRGHLIPDDVYTGPAKLGGEGSLQQLEYVESDFRAEVLVKEWNLNSEGIDQTFEWDGDTDDILIFESINAAIPIGSNVKMIFNGDTTSSYGRAYVTQDGTSGSFNGFILFEDIRLTNSYNTTSSEYTIFYLKNTGTARTGFTQITSERSDQVGRWHAGIKGHKWDNTTDKITSIRIYTDNTDLTGMFRLYKKAKIQIPIRQPLSKGKQSLKVEYATTSGVYINPGEIHMKNSDFSMYDLENRTEVTYPGTFDVSKWYYVYTNVSGSGFQLDDTNFYFNLTPPTIDYPNMAWYKANDRCIGAFQTNGSSEIIGFRTNRGSWTYVYEVSVFGSAVVTTVWSTVNFDLPDFVQEVHVNFSLPTYVANGSLYYREIGATTSDGFKVLQSSSNGRVGHNALSVGCTSSQQGEIKFSTDSTNEAKVYQHGYVIPDYIYTGA